MKKHLAISIFLVVAMASWVRCTHQRHTHCYGHPVVRGAEHLLRWPSMWYRCIQRSPYARNGRWNCWRKHWQGGRPFTCAVNGGWATWGAWSPWSATCGAATRTRTRPCDNPPPAHGGADCVGIDTDTESRHIPPCPLDGGWSPWGTWCPWSATCDAATRTRHRACTNPPPAHGGADCAGSETGTELGNTPPCPVDGDWTTWGDWSTWSATCGAATRTRTRSCTNPPPAHDGADCAGSDTETEWRDSPPLSELCSGKWTLAYEHGPNGHYVSGDKAALIAAAQRGAEIRLKRNIYYTTVQNSQPTDEGELCGQIMFHVSKQDYETFHDNSEWRFVYACTSGNWHSTDYLVEEHVQGATFDLKRVMTWFIRINIGEDAVYIHPFSTREPPCIARPIYEVTDAGNVISGSVAAVIAAVKQGADLRIRTTSDEYTFPVDNVQFDEDQSLVSAQALWHVSEQIAPSGDVYIFQDDAFWRFTITSTDGEQDISRWSIGDHVDRGHDQRNVTSAWYVDPCWEPVYRHDQDGNALEGSLSALRAAVEAGHRVKILYDDYSIEVDDVWMDPATVCAQMLSSVSRNGPKYFANDASWYWQTACSSGLIKTCGYLVGAPVFTSSGITQKNITWFVDKRTWTSAFSVLANESVVSGSTTAVRQAVQNGADVRYSITSDDISIFLGADNMVLPANGDIAAMNIRAVDLFTYQSWWYTLLTGSGRLDSIKWQVGEHTSLGHSATQVDAEFFINE